MFKQWGVLWWLHSFGEHYKTIQRDYWGIQSQIFGADQDDLEEEVVIFINDFVGEEEEEEEDLDCALIENL